MSEEFSGLQNELWVPLSATGDKEWETSGPGVQREKNRSGHQGQIAFPPGCPTLIEKKNPEVVHGSLLSSADRALAPSCLSPSQYQSLSQSFII